MFLAGFGKAGVLMGFAFCITVKSLEKVMSVAVDWPMAYAAQLSLQQPTFAGDALLAVVAAVPPQVVAAEKHDGATAAETSTSWRLFREPKAGFPLLRVKQRNAASVTLPGPSTAYAVRIDSTPFAKQFAANGGLGAHSLLDIPAFDARQWQVYKIPSFYIIAKQSVSIAIHLTVATAYFSDGAAGYTPTNESESGSMLITSGTNIGVESIRPRIESETTLENFVIEWPSLGATAWTLDNGGGSDIRFTSMAFAFELSDDAVRWTPITSAT